MFLFFWLTSILYYSRSQKCPLIPHNLSSSSTLPFWLLLIACSYILLAATNLLLCFIFFWWFPFSFFFLFLQKDMDPKCLSYERISDVSSSSLSGTSPKKPNLEFTLGVPHWYKTYTIFLIYLCVYYLLILIISLNRGEGGAGEENQVPPQKKSEKRKRELKKDRKQQKEKGVEKSTSFLSSCERSKSTYYIPT